MATAPGGASRAARSRTDSRDRSIAQWYCLIVGLHVLLAGSALAVGLISDYHRRAERRDADDAS
jgi:hypothetical protein